MKMSNMKTCLEFIILCRLLSQNRGDRTAEKRISALFKCNGCSFMATALVMNLQIPLEIEGQLSLPDVVTIDSNNLQPPGDGVCTFDHPKYTKCSPIHPHPPFRVT